MEQPFPDKIETQFSRCDNKLKYTCRFDKFYLSDRIQAVKYASEGELTDGDLGIENFCQNKATRTLEVKCSYYSEYECTIFGTDLSWSPWS